MTRQAILTTSSFIVTAIASGQVWAQQAESGGGLEEIVVTAQKREQSLQDVPIAVTAITQDTIQANRIVSVNDLSSIAPGVTVKPSPGGSSVPVFTIRGQSSFGVVPGSDKQVSIYIDGVYVSSPRGSIFELPDIQRIEVLRGPQGTLFGRNATAGAISITTRDPTGEARIKAEGTVGNRDGYRVRMTADLPQMGSFSAFGSFVRNYRHGEVRNAAAGLIWNRDPTRDGREKVAGALVVSCGQASGVFEFSEEALDHVAISVEEGAEGEALPAVALCGDVGEAALRLDTLADGIAVIGFVSEEDAPFRHCGHQRVGLSAITGLSFGEVNPNRQPSAIDQRMDLRCQTASGTSHAAI